jgi:hypothetical protein
MADRTQERAVQNAYQQYQQLMLERLFQGQQAWPQAVYLAGMFAIVLWRKESVVNWRLFRLSYLLYAASLILPPIVLPLFEFVTPGGVGKAESQIFLYMISSGLGTWLFAAAVICGLGSMMPRLIIHHADLPPQKHPLD